MGSSEALLYFDEDGVVVAMCAQKRVTGLELTATFKAVVGEIGTRVNKAFNPRSQISISNESGSASKEEETTTTSKLSFVSATNETFVLPPDNSEWVRTWNFEKRVESTVSYLRTEADITKRGRKADGCSPLLEVLHWLTSEMKERNDTLMMAYGNLIHIHREKDLVNNATGKLYDDDIDMWLPLHTFAHMASVVEPELFRLFGWTMRVFVSKGDKYVILGQLLSSCGHKVSSKAGKAYSTEPAIELYPIASYADDEQNATLKDLWSGYQFQQSMMFPGQRISFKTTGFSRPLQLQLPSKPLSVLRCLYGKWEVPSSKKRAKHKCVDEDVGGDYAGDMIVAKHWSKWFCITCHVLSSCAAYLTIFSVYRLLLGKRLKQYSYAKKAEK